VQYRRPIAAADTINGNGVITDNQSELRPDV